LSDKYKIILFVIGGKEGTAFGGGTDDKIGMLWTPAARIQKAPYGALAHELERRTHGTLAGGYGPAKNGSFERGTVALRNKIGGNFSR
jgi:hypothetical protein